MRLVVVANNVLRVDAEHFFNVPANPPAILGRQAKRFQGLQHFRVSRKGDPLTGANRVKDRADRTLGDEAGIELFECSRRGISCIRKRFFPCGFESGVEVFEILC